MSTETRARRAAEAAANEEGKGQDQPLEVDADLEEGEELDFSVVTDMEPVEHGKPYLSLITKFDFGKSSTGGGRYTVNMVVSEPEMYAGRIMSRSYSTQPNALFGLFALLGALGEDTEKMKTEKKKVVGANYIGMALVGYADNREYQDVMRSQIGRVRHAETWEAWTPTAQPGQTDEADGDQSSEPDPNF